MNEFIKGYRISSRDEVPIQPHPTDYLKPKKGSEHPLEKLHVGAVELGSNCLGREAEFTEYQDPPTDDEAEAMCYRCPVFDLCAQYAETGHPAWGIWAGKVRGRSLAVPQDQEKETP